MPLTRCSRRARTPLGPLLLLRRPCALFRTKALRVDESFPAPPPVDLSLLDLDPDAAASIVTLDVGAQYVIGGGAASAYAIRRAE